MDALERAILWVSGTCIVAATVLFTVATAACVSGVDSACAAIGGL